MSTTNLHPNNDINVSNVNNKISNEIELNKLAKEARSKILLKFVNKILSNLNKPTISSLLSFVEIDRDDILNDINRTIFDEMESEILEHFNKEKYLLGKKKSPKKFVLNFLKSACSESGYNLNYVKKDNTVLVDGRKYRRTLFLYSIN